MAASLLPAVRTERCHERGERGVPCHIASTAGCRGRLEPQPLISVPACVPDQVLSNIVCDEPLHAPGVASPSTAVANLVGSLAVLLSTLFGGFLLSRKQMPHVVGWLARLSFVRSGRPPAF